MRPHRAFLPTLKSDPVLRGPEAKHLLDVLRVQVGDSFTVFDGSGLESTAKVLSVDNLEVQLSIGDPVESSKEPPMAVELYISLLKGDKLSDIVRAATELGATKIIPMISQHCVATDMGSNKLERIRRVALEAAKQSQRTVIPEVTEPILIRNIPEVKQGFVAHPYGSRVLNQEFSTSESVSLATGPEGGFSDKEIELLEQKGFKKVTLGPRILRAETAPIALLSLITSANGF